MFSLIPRRREKRVERALAPRPAAAPGLMGEFAPLFKRFFVPWPAPFAPLGEEPEPWDLKMADKGPEVVVRAEMAGFEASEIEVLFTGELLTIRAEHKRPPEGEGKGGDRAPAGAGGAAAYRHGPEEGRGLLPRRGPGGAFAQDAGDRGAAHRSQDVRLVRSPAP
jgi:HSP20 family molecular chaperone IbpA